MKIAFWKMHGAANDFILVDDRKQIFPVSDPAWIARMASRRTGVGCEGIVLIQGSAHGDVRMRFFNPDGREAQMCGNAVRCVARLASEMGLAPASMTIETGAGLVRAERRPDGVRISLSSPADWRINRSIRVEGRRLICHFLNTGVPHAVVEVDDLPACEVVRLGRAIRRHRLFAPEGTNADFMRATGLHSLAVRTYERGVEDETLACGTGAVACALVAARLGRVRPPVEVTPASGDALTVDFRLTEDGSDGVSLLGPAEHVFRGEIEYAARPSGPPTSRRRPGGRPAAQRSPRRPPSAVSRLYRHSAPNRP